MEHFNNIEKYSDFFNLYFIQWIEHNLNVIFYIKNIIMIACDYQIMLTNRRKYHNTLFHNWTTQVHLNSQLRRPDTPMSESLLQLLNVTFESG